LQPILHPKHLKLVGIDLFSVVPLGQVAKHEYPNKNSLLGSLQEVQLSGELGEQVLQGSLHGVHLPPTVVYSDGHSLTQVSLRRYGKGPPALHLVHICRSVQDLQG